LTQWGERDYYQFISNEKESKMNHIEQAQYLIDTAMCNLPLTYDDVARRVAKHELFPLALQKTMQGNRRLLDMITLTAALELCQEQLDA
jgi:hypothetical protein